MLKRRSREKSLTIKAGFSAVLIILILGVGALLIRITDPEFWFVNRVGKK